MFYRDKNTWAKRTTLFIKTNWIPLAHCVQRKWLLKFYVMHSRKDTTIEFPLLWIAKCCYGNCLWSVLYKRDRCSQEAAVNLHIGIKKYFLEYLSHFVKKKAKMMINIDLDTPSDNCSCTFKCFRAVKLYKLVCWSDCVIFGFDQDGEYLLNSQSSLRRRMRSAQKFYNLLYLVTFKLQWTWL